VTTLLVNKNNTFESLIHLTLTFGTGGRFINTSRCPLCLKVLAGLYNQGRRLNVNPYSWWTKFKLFADVLLQIQLTV